MRIQNPSANRILSLAFFAVVLFSGTSHCSADLIVDENLSTTTITIAGGSDTSATGGTLDLIVNPGTSPFNTAQIFDLDLVLTEGINIQILGGAVTFTGAPDALTVNMVTPGAPGTVSGGLFDQLGNTIQPAGPLDVNDPLGLAGGTRTIDLSSLGTPTIDFINVQISSVNDVVTIDTLYSFTDFVDGTQVNVIGRIVASGAARVPEPSSMAVIMVPAIAFWRRRSVC